jgi:hypothetical protein
MAESLSDRVEPKDAPAAQGDVAVKRRLAQGAQRALAEAAARRAAAPSRPQQQSSEEFQGRGGLDPVRYGDWEVKGIASDF